MCPAPVFELSFEDIKSLCTVQEGSRVQSRLDESLGGGRLRLWQSCSGRGVRARR
ncbi:uncharacterized protein BDV14DRAFT_168593 [Aspergillus stella-maris]|uniref:uncharacterized protein n=1 Tax=Aspergillus stella-maris TaxID=1810926 RepID=UPI003CCCB24E